MLKFEVIPVTQFAQNCSLIWCDETSQAALVDPGGEADKLLAADALRYEAIQVDNFAPGELEGLSQTNPVEHAA